MQTHIKVEVGIEACADIGVNDDVIHHAIFDGLATRIVEYLQSVAAIETAVIVVEVISAT